MNFCFLKLRPFFLKISLLVIGCIACAPASFAQIAANGSCTDPNSAGQKCAITTAVPFLMICPDARSGALGEAGVTIADNANGVYWNPAILPFIDKKMGFSVNYTPWLRGLGIPDINHAFLPGYYNFGEKGGVLSGALTFFSLGNIQLTTADGSSIGQVNPSEMALTAAYSRKVTKKIGAGVALRYIYSGIQADNSGGIAVQSSNSFAGDINVFYKTKFSLSNDTPVELRLGANATNFGAKMNYSSGTSSQRDFLPANLKVGYSLKFDLDDANSLTFMNDFNKLLVPTYSGDYTHPKSVIDGVFSSFNDAHGGISEEISEINMSYGLEYWYDNIIAGRMGFFYEDPNKGARKFLTFGAGIRFNVFWLDIAYLAPLKQNHPLQNTFRFTLNFNFGEMKQDY